MTSPAYDGAGSLFAIAMRLTKLAENGAPLVGAENSYRTSSLVQMESGLEYEDGDEIVQKNGAGVVCLTYKAPDTLKRGTISSLQICQPDPYVLQFLQGGRVLEGDTGNLGYGAPEVGVESNPNGVSIELVTHAIVDGAKAGYFWWVHPRAFVRTSGGWVKSGSDPLLPEFEGNSTQNPNWGDGPQNDWVWPSDRVWQYMQVDELPWTIPDVGAFDTVDAELTVTSLAVTPATDSITVGEEVQLVAEATMSDLSVRDVTQSATWESANPAVVTVNADGEITGVSAGGPVSVTATYRTGTDSAAITVA